MDETPDRFYINKPDKKIYEKLLGDVASPFGKGKKFQIKDIFILATCYGFLNKVKTPIEKREGYLRKEYLSADELHILYAMIAAEKKDLRILLKPKEVFHLIEEYANAGIHLLNNMVFKSEFGSFEKKFESELVELYNKIIENE